VLVFVTETWDYATHQAFLAMMRSHWRGWHIVLFEDRGSSHTAAASRRLAKALHMALRFLPTATPELNAMDHLWRQVKGRVPVHRPIASIDAAADQACWAILNRSRHERLRKAGVLSRVIAYMDPPGIARAISCDSSQALRLHAYIRIWTPPDLQAENDDERQRATCVYTTSRGGATPWS
jgi:transposase